VHNPHEPEAQWSTKSTTAQKEWVGYKVQVAETVEDAPCAPGEPTRSVITAVVTQAATASDKAALPDVEAAWTKSGQARPDKLYVDAGYTSGKELARAQAQDRQLQGPVQPAPQRDGRLSAEAFAVEVEERRAVCPAGHASTQCSRLEQAKTGRVNFRFEWTGGCASCPLRDQCVAKDQPHRSLLVGEHHALVQERRRVQQTEPFQQDMHRRNGIEGTISELVRGHGLRRARFRGQAKVRLANLFIGAAANCRRWWRRRVWEEQRARAAALSGIEAMGLG
jgi:transposase